MRVPSVSIALLLCIAAAAGGQTAPDTAALRQNAEAAERTGSFREALRLYTALQRAYKENADRPEDDWVYPIIFRLATSLRPPPALPDSAEIYEIRAQAVFDAAGNPSDFSRAANEFRNAIRVAPWKPDYFYNLALISEEMGRLADALRSYRLYLQHPAIADRDAMRRRLIALEFQFEEQRARYGAFDEWIGEWLPYTAKPDQLGEWTRVGYTPYAPLVRRGDTLYIGRTNHFVLGIEESGTTNWRQGVHYRGVIRGPTMSDVAWFESVHPGFVPESFAQCSGFNISGVYPVRAAIVTAPDGSKELHFTKTEKTFEDGCKILEGQVYTFAFRRRDAP